MGAHPIRVRAQGVMNGKTVERLAAILYPWQRTGYLRGPTDGQELLLTVSRSPLFDLEAPASWNLVPGRTTELALTLRWFTDGQEGFHLKLARGPDGVDMERFEFKPGSDRVTVWLRASGDARDVSKPLVFVGSVRDSNRLYSKATPDIEVRAPDQGKK